MLYAVANVRENCASSLASLMYRWYASLRQRPKLRVTKSFSSVAAAVVAAPMRKLWPEYYLQLKPRTDLDSRRYDTKRWRDRREPSLKIKRGPCDDPLLAKYANSAETGQSSLPDFPREIMAPRLKRSVFDYLMATRTIWEASLSRLTRLLESGDVTGQSFD